MPRILSPAAFAVHACLAVGLFLLLAASTARAQCWQAAPGLEPAGGCAALPGYASTIGTFDGVTTLIESTDCGVQAWIGGQWVQFGGFPVGIITSLITYNGQLFVGGSFSKIGSDAVYNVAMWNGSHWVQIGDGFTGGGDPRNTRGIVNAMLVFNGVLWIGGSLVPVDTGTWTAYATWDGTTLTPGTYTQAVMSGFAIWNNQLYASTTAGVPAVWHYDNPGWTHIGYPADQSIHAIANYNGTLIVGGEFTNFFTGVPIHGVAQFDGTQWQPMGAGIGSGSVTSLQVYNGLLYAAGSFQTMDHQVVNNVAAWDGNAWSGVGGGVQLYDSGTSVNSMGQFQGELDALGWITGSGGHPDTSIARWNGYDWLPFTGGMNGAVRAFLPRGTTMDMGGDFNFVTTGGTSASFITATNDTTVGALMDSHGFTGPDGSVFTMALLPGRFPFLPPTLIVGGAFANVEGASAPNVAQFGTAGWGTMGAGLNGQVSALQLLGKTMYAAGHFTGSGATALSHIALFNGAWADPGLGAFGPLDAMIASGSQLIIGGVPGGADGVSVWDGTTMTPLGTADGRVYALTTFNGDIIAGGFFSTIGGTFAPGVARRDAATGQWVAMGSGLNSYVFALAVHNSRLYAGGSFTASGGATARRLAVWTGSSWSEVGGGLDNPVYALASWNGQLHVGGAFNESLTGVLSPFWIEHNALDCDADVPATSERATLRLGASYPNPARDRAEVRFSLEKPGPVRVSVLDLAGRRVRTLEEGWSPAGERTIAWDGENSLGRPCPAGVYLFVLEADGRRLSTRTVQLH
jgi:hypothetical protein